MVKVHRAQKVRLTKNLITVIVGHFPLKEKRRLKTDHTDGSMKDCAK